MSELQFVESLSADPVERAIAARVSAILNHPRLDRVQREEFVRQAQRELLQHRQRQASASAKVSEKKKTRQRGAAVDPIAARRRELGRVFVK